MKVRYFPFDEQFCPVQISAWTYSDQEMVLYEAGTMKSIRSNYTGMISELFILPEVTTRREHLSWTSKTPPLRDWS